MTLIDDEELRLDIYKNKDKKEGKRCLAQDTHKNNSKKCNSVLSTCAEDFRKELKVSNEEYQKRVREKLCLRCGKKGHFVKEGKDNLFGNMGKNRQG